MASYLYNSHIEKGLQSAKSNFQSANHPVAISEYEKAINIDPKRPEAYFHIGRSRLEMGDTGEAMMYFNVVLSITPLYRYLHLHIGKALMQRNLGKNLIDKFKEALKHFDEELKNYPDCSETHCEKGKAYLTHQFYDMAMNHFTKSILSDQNNYMTMTLKGKALHELGNFSEAIQEFEKAIQINPEYTEAYKGKIDSISALQARLEDINPYNLNRKGEKSASEEKYDEAIRQYDLAIQYDPRYFEALKNKGEALRLLGKHHDANTSFDNAIDVIKTSLYKIHNKKAKALKELNRYNEAIDELNLAISLQPDCCDAYHSKGLILHKQKVYKEAIEQFDIVVSKRPDYWPSFFTKGVALSILGKYEEAFEHFEKVEKINPNYIYILFEKAKALVRLQKYDEAISQFNEYIKVSINHITAYELSSKALKTQGNHEEAEKQMKKANEIKDSLYKCYSGKGEALLSLGHFEEALCNFEFAIEINNNFAFAHLNKGKCLLLMQKYEDALKAFETAALYESKPVYVFLKGIAIAHLVPQNKSQNENYECAISHFDEASKTDREKYCPYVAKGIVLNKLGRYKEAVKEFDNALKINSNLSSAYYNKYLALKSLNEDDEAAIAKENATRIKKNLTHSDHTSLLNNDSYPFKEYK